MIDRARRWRWRSRQWWRWRSRLAGLVAVAGFLAAALAIRTWAGQGVLDSSGALAQYSGTVLYASMSYAAVFVLAPRTRPLVAGAIAVGFCWLVEFLQLTGVPAYLSERSPLARLALGVRFDVDDVRWYPVGVLPLVALHLAARWLVTRGPLRRPRRTRRSARRRAASRAGSRSPRPVRGYARRGSR